MAHYDTTDPEVIKALEAVKTLEAFCLNHIQMNRVQFNNHYAQTKIDCSACPFYINDRCNIENLPCDYENEVISWFEISEEETAEDDGDDVTPYDEADTYDV